MKLLKIEPISGKENAKKILRIFLPALAIFLIVFAIFYKFEFNLNNPYFSGEDAFYHVGMARYIMEHGIPQKFPYLFFTIINERFVDHQLLFHILLIPFIKTFGDIAGPKIFTLLFTAGIFSMLYLLFREAKLKLAFLYPILIFLLLPSDFYFRSAFIRVQSISLFLMLLALYLMIKKSYILLGILSFLFVWLYGGSVFIPILILIYGLIPLFKNEKIEWKVLLYGLGGFVLGIILNPYFPKNLGFLYSQIFQTGLGAQTYSGGEWRPYDSWFWVQISMVPILLFFAGLILSSIKNIRQTSLSVTILIFSLFMLFLQWKSKRFVEYWPVWASLSAFFLAGNYLESILLNIKKSLKTAEGWLVVIAVIAFVPFSVSYFQREFSRGLKDTKTTWNVEKARGVHKFLKENSDQGDVVFTDDWDVFPVYFYLNQKNYYIVGLDPEFMNQYSPVLYREFAGISSGNDSSNLDRIRKDFNAKWVLVANDHLKFKSNLEANPDLFDKVYDDGYYFLFKVISRN